MPTVYTGGTFDLFHVAHVSLLAQCRKIAGPDGRVVVSLNTDGFVLRYKRKAPVCDYQERREVLLACRHVDEVIENSMGADSRPAIEAVRPDFIVIGVDWATRDYYQQMGFDQSWLDSRNITLVYVAHTHSLGITTTLIKERMNAR